MPPRPEKKESRRTLMTEKMRAAAEDAIRLILNTLTSTPLQVDNGISSRAALQKVQQALSTKELEQWVKSVLEETGLNERLVTIDKTTKTEKKHAPKCGSLKFNMILKEVVKIVLIISVAKHEVNKGLS